MIVNIALNRAAERRARQLTSPKLEREDPRGMLGSCSSLSTS